MIVDQMKDLVMKGLPQPEAEPVFFTYPSRYGYQQTSTTYGVHATQITGGVSRVKNAQLEPSSK